jgi:hypothetical protein
MIEYVIRFPSLGIVAVPHSLQRHAAHPLLGHPAGHSLLLPDDQRLQPAQHSVFGSGEVTVLDLSAALAFFLEELVLFGVSSALKIVLGTAGGCLIVVVGWVMVVAVDDVDEGLQFAPLNFASGGYLLVADVEEILVGGGSTLRVSSVSIM